MDIFEDMHEQLEIKGSDGNLVKQLLDYDIILRLNDDETGYAGFEIVHYPTNETLIYEEFQNEKTN